MKLLRHLKHNFQWKRAGSGADTQFESARVKSPLMQVGIVIAQRLKGDREVHQVSLLGLKEEFLEATQRLLGAVEGSLEVMKIDLDNLSPHRGAGIGEFNGEGNNVLGGRFRASSRILLFITN